jgi:hypothetical protein
VNSAQREDSEDVDEDLGDNEEYKGRTDALPSVF